MDIKANKTLNSFMSLLTHEVATSSNSSPEKSFILKILTHSPTTISLTAYGGSMRFRHPATATHRHYHL
ncbi:unnamed protein product [Sphenostylis stenocarpa]|uniref:Uncharacterized protein n=1 Tax=Sphenostylis stenocarpa TaxID=92480 RepID=A0AA86S7V9_9FABA|nr:unnamed protein product [Sphenostylis stenocarpa]